MARLFSDGVQVGVGSDPVDLGDGTIEIPRALFAGALRAKFDALASSERGVALAVRLSVEGREGEYLPLAWRSAFRDAAGEGSWLIIEDLRLVLAGTATAEVQ